MTADITNASLQITKVHIGGYLTLGVDARALHRALGSTAEFATWIKVGIATGNFLENQDFIRREHGRARTEFEDGLDYFVTLDTADHMALEAQTPSRAVIRTAILTAKESNRFAFISDQRPSFDRDLSDVVRHIVKKELSLVVASLIDDKRIQIRYGKTAGQIWHDKGWPSAKTSNWFGNRLAEAGCLIDGGGYGELGRSRARLFDPDKADRWLAGGGLKIVDLKILEVLGQGAFRFASPSSPCT